jgi:hypothetical protein
MVVLGRSEILAVSKLSSAILADFDMRGSAISVWTASIVMLGSFLGLLLFMDSFRDSALQFPDEGSSSTVGGLRDHVCAVLDTSVAHGLGSLGPFFFQTVYFSLEDAINFAGDFSQFLRIVFYFRVLA